MSVVEAVIIGPWAADGQGGKTPQVERDYGISQYVDLTAQPAANIPPAPNAFVHLVRCDAATFAQIEMDATYAVLTVEEVQ